MTSTPDHSTTVDAETTTRNRSGRALGIVSIVLAVIGMLLTWKVSNISGDNQQFIVENQELIKLNQESIAASQHIAEEILKGIDSTTAHVRSNTESIDLNTTGIADNQAVAHQILNNLGVDQDSIRTDQAGIVLEQRTIRDLAQDSFGRQDEIGRVLSSIEELTGNIRDLSEDTYEIVSAPDSSSGIVPSAPDGQDSSGTNAAQSSGARVELSIGAAAHDHWACPDGEDCRWMQVTHSGLGDGPWEVKCATHGLSRSQSNNVDPAEHEVWRIYQTTFNPTNGCLYWHEGNTVYVIMDGNRSNDLRWNP